MLFFWLKPQSVEPEQCRYSTKQPSTWDSGTRAPSILWLCHLPQSLQKRKKSEEIRPSSFFILFFGPSSWLSLKMTHITSFPFCCQEVIMRLHLEARRIVKYPWQGSCFLAAMLLVEKEHISLVNWLSMPFLSSLSCLIAWKWELCPSVYPLDNIW